MSAWLVLSNIGFWSVQIAFLVAAAALLPPLLGLKVPNARLAFLQMVLLTCLLLPFVRSWKQEVVSRTISVPATVATGTPVTAPMPAKHPSSLPTELLLIPIAAGIPIRLGLLLTGLLRLHRYRRRSIPLEPASAWSAEADLRISNEVAGPVTFGFRKPVVLLPARFSTLSEGMQDAILCHEILHVRRRDWLYAAGEECVRAFFWFHPAIWWLLYEIQLVREQAVDREVVEITRNQDGYIDALLVIAGAPLQTDLVPAPLFLRKKYLKKRIVSILKEVPMSKAKSISALAVSLTMLAASCWFITGAFRMQAAPQEIVDPSGVSVDTRGAQLMHRQRVDYSREAIAKGIQGTVVANVNLDAEGSVTDASIVSGPEELRKTVLQSLLNWHFAPETGVGSHEIGVAFTLPPRAAQTITVRGNAPASRGENHQVSSIQIVGLSESARQQLLSRLPVHINDVLTADLLGQTLSVVHAFDSHLGTIVNPVSATEAMLSIAPTGASAATVSLPVRETAPARVPDIQSALTSPPQAQAEVRTVHIGSNVASANIVNEVPPAYPPLAKAAGVQGVVKFEVTIGTDGSVKDLKLLSGPPLLVNAAMQSVSQTIYKPTLLNGAPVSVITTVDVNFTLAQ